MSDNKLSAYRSKRDFGKTAEPSGDAGVAAGDRPRFVIQKHAARQLHYDLRLEWDGVFKSWAVTRGPSLDPADKRLAVEVEDHPLEYGDFEGTIPKGEYGGGTVQLWDRGYWTPEGERSAADAYAAGDLKFTLDGERLSGSWVLVRMKKDRTGGKRTNWLLIKHRDAAAREGDGKALLREDRSVASGRPMAAIAAGKGTAAKPFIVQTKKAIAPDAVWDSSRGSAAELRAARAVVPAPKARAAAGKPEAPRKQKWPGFVAPQLCRSVERPPTGEGWVHEIKFDGYRMQMAIRDGSVVLRTRTGLDWTDRFPEIAVAGQGIGEAIIDGEIAALDSEGVPDFAAMQEALAEKSTGDLLYFAFDLLFADGEDLRQLPLSDRKARLARKLESTGRNGTAMIRYVDHFDTGGEAILQAARRMSLEGIVSKRLEAPYRSGRQDSWTKAKCRDRQDVVIGGWTGKTNELRSLLVGARRDGKLVYLGRVGTGFGRETVARVLPRLMEYERKSSPFEGANAPKREPGVHWAEPDLVAEIEFGGWGAQGLVRQGAFKGLRDDKPAAEVEVEPPANAARVDAIEPVAGYDETTAAPSRSRRKGRVVVMGVVLSHPDKVLWPGAGDGKPVSKTDLALYYESVGPWMIEHLRGRPCSIVRAPDGIDAEQFFQRHAMQGTSELLALAHVRGDKKPYLQIDRVEGLAAVAQIAGVELHPWNCAPREPDNPGRLVFDIDPGPDVAFGAVIEAAREIRDRLQQLGLVGFCKTTGGKGLHVVVPLKQTPESRPDWPQAKEFAHAVCRAMRAASPRLYIETMAKKERQGRIFLDYLRNDRLATAVAPLSPRARPGATVSMPLDWGQVRNGLDPQRFTIRTVPGLLGRGKAWQDYETAAQPLQPAIEKLGHEKLHRR